MLLDLVELAAPPGLWPQLGRPLLRTRDQIVPDIVLCVADSVGSMPRRLRLDRVSDVPSSRHHFSVARIPGHSSDYCQRWNQRALAFDFPAN